MEEEDRSPVQEDGKRSGPRSHMLPSWLVLRGKKGRLWLSGGARLWGWHLDGASGKLDIRALSGILSSSETQTPQDGGGVGEAAEDTVSFVPTVPPVAVLWLSTWAVLTPSRAAVSSPWWKDSGGLSGWP